MAPSSIIYLIRHGEKPPVGENLSAEGITRSQALPAVFGPSSGYNIKCIFAQKPKSHGKEARPYETVEPLAAKLGVNINSSVERDDAPSLANKVRAWVGNEQNQGNVLVCWEHKQLKNLVEAITGLQDAPDYPGKRFDLIYTINPPYTAINSVTSENTDADKELPQPRLDGNTIVA